MKYNLGELISVVSGFAFKSQEFSEVGIPVIKIKNIVPPSINIENTKKMAFDSITKYNKWLLNYNDILISMTGSKVDQMSSAVGKVGRVKTHRNLLMNQRVGKLVVERSNVLDTDFFYFWISRYEVQYILALSSSGSANQANINSKNIYNLEIDLPPLNVQKKNAYALTTIDSKIELNNQIISTLEQIATTLFKHWFVDFEFPDKNGNPYKSSGGKMIESELGEIPEGWEISSLKNIAEIIMGQSPKGSSYNNDGMGLPLINGASDFKNGFVNPQKCTTEPKKVTQKDDIIFGVRATIGNSTIVKEKYAIGRGAGLARVNENYYQEFLFLLLNNMFEYFQNTGTGSVYINISKKDFEDSTFINPSLEVTKKFHELNTNIFTLIANKRSEIEILEKTRDTLLPKLLSGEIELE